MEQLFLINKINLLTTIDRVQMTMSYTFLKYVHKPENYSVSYIQYVLLSNFYTE